MLGPDDRGQFLALTDRDPVINVFAGYRGRLTNLEERWLGGQVWGRFRGPDLVAACHMAANLVPVGCTPEDARAFAGPALRRMRTTGTMVGPRDAIEALWDEVRDRWTAPREARWDQPHLEADAAAAIPGCSGVRRSTPVDLDALYPACVAMYAEEIGVSPESEGGGELYRARVLQLINRGWSFASYDDDGRVVFKAEVACATADAAQVQGVWVRPDRRGEGLGASGMAAVVDQVRERVAPVVSLYVNAWNEPARRAYERVGFRQTATFSTLMF